MVKSLKLNEFMPYRLSILTNLVSDFVSQSYKDKFSLTTTEWRIMAVLGEQSDISADEIAVKTRMEKSIVSRAIGKLINRHLIERKFDPADRRRSMIKLTGTGEAVYEDIVPRASSCEKRILECFSDEESDQFDRLVGQLFLHVSRINTDD